MKKKMDIIFENKELLVINKPAKLLTIATEKEKEHTLYHEASLYVKKQNPKNKIFIVHRLDKDTSGIVVFAKNEKLKKELQSNWNQCVITREYLAIVQGKLEKAKDTIINYLKENKTLQIFDTKNPKIGKKAITEYEVIKQRTNDALLKIQIKTGRKNQIRVAMYSINHPIIGDKKYQSNKNSYGRLALHASKLVFLHPSTKQKYTFISKIPKDWKNDYRKELENYEKENLNA